MKIVKLTQGKVAFVDAEDFDRVNRFKWCATFMKTGWYAIRSLPRNGRPQRHVLLHQFVLPGTLLIDHRDGNGLNCQKSNLRSATKSQNGQNSKKRLNKCSSQFKGVCWDTRASCWRAYIHLNGKQKHLGFFQKETDAAKRYDEFAVSLFGDFAKINL